jgi:hypothetical protein
MFENSFIISQSSVYQYTDFGMGGIFAYPCNPPDSNSIIFAPASPDNSKHNSRYQKSSISADENIILKTSNVLQTQIQNKKDELVKIDNDITSKELNVRNLEKLGCRKYPTRLMLETTHVSGL